MEVSTEIVAIHDLFTYKFSYHFLSIIIHFYGLQWSLKTTGKLENPFRIRCRIKTYAAYRGISRLFHATDRIRYIRYIRYNQHKMACFLDAGNNKYVYYVYIEQA